ncbi:MAG TPA: hypothetical protein VNB22_20070 [Pyrinomonadaceae bacterium]|nr:hypothetical protein [Pyrinomonadaceae bacterium]
MQTGKNRKGEKGAAMVMVLMITLLLLAAIGGLLLEVSMNTANITDATAEQQAYNAAESGIQSAINVLRGNILLDPTKPASDPVNQVNFRKAVTKSVSNAAGDTSNVARLSRWMNYNYTPTGASIADRIKLNPNYEPRTGYAFGVSVIDPDNTGNIIAFNTTKTGGGAIYDSRDKTWKNTITFATLTITYTPSTPTTLDVSSGSANTSYGNFQFSGTGDIPEDLRFEVLVNMTAPYSISRGLRGYIKAGKVTAGSYDTVQVDFDSKVSQLMGSTITLDNDPMSPDATNGKISVTGNMTSAEPFRVVVTSTGYGPRGAKKVLEATIQKNFFNGMTAPATLTLVGPAAGAVFEPGSSSVTEYSGKDVASTVIIPPIGTTNDANLETVLQKTSGDPPHPFNGKITGTSANVNSEMPFWLQNPTNLNGTVESLKLTAISSGRYFPSGTTPPNVGDNATARGITFVDGDLILTPELSGGGILVVTGKLTLKGNFNFNGLILVTGANGVERSGGGTGTLQGNIIVAPYNPSNLNAGFLPPKYDLSGGGNSGVIYNSSSVANGMVAVSNFVLGVAEK